MGEKIALREDVGSLDVSPRLAPYSGVRININDDEYVEAGNDESRVLEFDNPFGTQEMAESILHKLTTRGYQYQPYQADGAMLDPAAEIGDAVDVRDVYGGIFKRSRSFGKLMRADIAAPHEEEIDHEYKFETTLERAVKRRVGQMTAELLVLSGKISAKVSKQSPGGQQTSFSWLMDDTSHTWYSNGTQVLRIDGDGLTVHGSGSFSGEIAAGTGFIAGFKIEPGKIWSGMQTLEDKTTNGVYIGTDGIALGKGNFVVTSSGELTAKSIKLYGNIKMYNSNGTLAGEITAANLRDGAQTTLDRRSTWNGTSTGWANVQTNSSSIGLLKAGTLSGGVVAGSTVTATNMYIGSERAYWGTVGGTRVLCSAGYE